jgi:D-alanine-D-alanine ligase
MTPPRLFRIGEADKRRLKLLFLAKHALSGGELHEEDGNHAVYHHEVLRTLRDIGLEVEPADDFSALYEPIEADFVFSLLNRAGFPMSEMLGPLLAQRIGVPCLGASAILRGLSDDKHLMKLAAAARGVPVAPWLVARRGALSLDEPAFAFEQLVVKPNASSASWGVSMPTSWDAARAAVAGLQQDGHDVIVEEHWGDYDVVVPVLGGDRPIILPTMRFELPGEDTNFRSYEEKRGLTEAPKEVLVPVDNPPLTETLRHYVDRLLPELWPFDYGRFEFRYDRTREKAVFMEVNLSCNLWSRKTMSGAAALVGIDHASLVEHITAYSMDRQGVIEAERYPLPAASGTR